MKKKSMLDIEVKGKRVLLRTEFNVPIQDGVIMDDSRIKASLPTIKNLLERGAAVILLTHLGRPKGSPDPLYTAAPIAAHLSTLLDQPVTFIPYDSEEAIAQKAAQVKPGQLALLENLRYWSGEESNDRAFAGFLASLGQVYINDAFGAAHRAHASTAGIARFLPAYAGLLVNKELEALGGVVHSPKRPLMVVMGGSKVSDKIGVIENLAGHADYIFFGGAMANTLLAAQGKNLGASKIEGDKLDMALAMMDRVAQTPCKLVYPVDLVVAEAFAPDAAHKVVEADQVPEGWMALDIGPATVALWQSLLAKAGTIVWNGPLGVYEMSAFAKGSNGVAQAMAQTKAVTVVGGGDAVAAVKAAGFAAKMSHLSTGGGASLEFLEGKSLPGIEVLIPAQRQPILAANWKMHKTQEEAAQFIQEFKAFLEGHPEIGDRAQMLICPPFTAIESLAREIKTSRLPVQWGAQNMHPKTHGAYTGEVSPVMLKTLGCSHVILGHSERRQIFGEGDAFINEKVLAALEHDLIPILCVGETLEERQEGRTQEVCWGQLKGGLEKVPAAAVCRMVLAYEPIWAIGTGVSAQTLDAQETIQSLRQWIAEHYDEETAAAVRIQYGGSVKGENVTEYMAQPDIDGALIGGAGLDPKGYGAIVTGALPVK